MNKQKVLLFPVLVAVLGLGACSYKGVAHPIEDYMSTIHFKTSGELRILQFSDLHLSSQRNLQVDYNFLRYVYDKACKDSPVDLVVITGDLFTFATKETVNATFAFFNSLGCKWTYTFGNHDEQLFSDFTYAAEVGKNYDNCLFNYQHDNMTGLTNSVINVKDSEEKTKFQLFVVDSNTYSYQNGIGYDYVHQDQIDWYEKGVKSVGATYVPSFIFQHIPLVESVDATKDGTLIDGENRESNSPSKTNSHFFDKIKELGSTKAIIVGHDHINNSDYLYEGVHFIYGIKSTDNIYHDDDMLGARVFNIDTEGNWETTTVTATYKEVK